MTDMDYECVVSGDEIVVLDMCDIVLGRCVVVHVPHEESYLANRDLPLDVFMFVYKRWLVEVGR